jgi:hypothetical protein
MKEDDSYCLFDAIGKLRMGGILIFTVPAHPFLFNAHDKLLGHYRRYKKHDFDFLYMEELRYWNTWLSIPQAIYKLLNKGEPKSDFKKLPKFINNLLYWILKLDNKKISFPWGLTIFGVYKR